MIDRKKIKGLFHSLRVQLMLFFTFAVFIVLISGSYFTYRNMFNILKENNEKLMLQQLEQTEYNIQNLTNETERVMGLFLMEDHVQKFLMIDNYSSVYEDVEMVWMIQKNADDIMFNYPYINSIYLFNENREVVGKSGNTNLIVRRGEREHNFYSTNMYNDVKKTYPDIAWYGGYESSFFNSQIKEDNGNKKFLITGVKGVKAVSNPKRNGILVFNINEDYLASIYGDTTDEHIYIMNKSGKIISSNDSKNIGNTSELFSRIGDKNFGSITINVDKIPMQVVYYKLQNMNWYILNEIPLNLNSENIILLQKMLLKILLLSILVIFILSYFWLKKVIKPLNELAGKMEDMGKGRLGFTFSNIPKNELGLVIEHFNEMSLNIVELIKRNEEIEKGKRKLEIEVLQAQINPHFLYNTLNVIKWMAAVIKSNDIVDCVVALGNILRPVFKSSEPLCTLEEEVRYVRNYIKIMNFRYGNSIGFDIDIPEELLKNKILRFILQPLIENAIIHGSGNMDRPICICLKAWLEGDAIIIAIKDSGIGMDINKLDSINHELENMTPDKQTNKGKGIGIININQRIRLYFGNSYGIKIESSEGRGTRILLKISKVE